MFVTVHFTCFTEFAKPSSFIKNSHFEVLRNVFLNGEYIQTKVSVFQNRLICTKTTNCHIMLRVPGLHLLESRVVLIVRFKVSSIPHILNCDSKPAQKYFLERTETTSMPALSYSFSSYRRLSEMSNELECRLPLFRASQLRFPTGVPHFLYHYHLHRSILHR